MNYIFNQEQSNDKQFVTNDLFKEIDLLIDEKSLCVKAYTGMFEERSEEISPHARSWSGVSS